MNIIRMDIQRFIQLATLAIGIFIVIAVMGVAFTISRLAQNNNGSILQSLASDEFISPQPSYGTILKMNDVLIKQNDLLPKVNSKDRPGVIKTMADIAKKRQDIFIQYGQKTPDQVATFVISSDQRAKLPPEVQTYIESDLLTAGTLTKDINSPNYFLTTLDGTVYSTVFINQPPSVTGPTSVTISGTAIGSYLFVSTDPTIVK